MSSKTDADTEETLRRLQSEVQALDKRGVRTLGDLLRTLGNDPRATRLKELLGRSTAAPGGLKPEDGNDRFE